ncbi:rRNA methylase [Brachybacterium faecium DSM 4810]|uniref:rRNA methylase n=1 Tax=Brachybacterium faecium (strain ATCC 43885 / DSM 4810 / JCM 11609 / LMG 19847 / NBRC 14762 / NCIMB 9860 / 6-10) TaxID=446465 RepID=C7MCZ9_BRAFD|nr:TrmH family RNA methyltransferase [Brachybacterium faecium]ACU85456.1 rRNA methylase [Brachybacterium faecium DSM 4810]
MSARQSPRRGRPGTASPPARIERRNALFQQWQALLTNRTKRTRSGEMLIQGVRPITQAISHGVEIRALLSDGREQPSRWAQDLLANAPAPVVVLAPELMAELGEREDGAPELLALAAVPSDSLDRLEPTGASLVVVFDRPSGPGNIGSLARSVDALGADALLLTGHSADAWDPAAIRASTGSLFAVPVMRLPSHREVLDWLTRRRALGEPWTVLGLDEAGGHDLAAADLTGPTLLVVGNETVGMSSGWREACDVIAEIPMTGAASSLNASVAGSVALYEARRQRRAAAP